MLYTEMRRIYTIANYQEKTFQKKGQRKKFGKFDYNLGSRMGELQHQRINKVKMRHEKISAGAVKIIAHARRRTCIQEKYHKAFTSLLDDGTKVDDLRLYLGIPLLPLEEDEGTDDCDNFSLYKDEDELVEEDSPAAGSASNPSTVGLGTCRIKPA